MSAYALRPARDTDTEFLHAVYAAGRADELAPVPWTDEQKAAFLRSQSEAQLAYYREHYASAEYSVVSVDGADVGRIFTAVMPEDYRVMDMGLLPHARGRGVGTALLADVIARAETLGLPVVLHVEAANPARRLYERAGFRDRGEVGPYRRMERPVAVRA